MKNQINLKPSVGEIIYELNKLEDSMAAIEAYAKEICPTIVDCEEISILVEDLKGLKAEKYSLTEIMEGMDVNGKDVVDGKFTESCCYIIDNVAAVSEPKIYGNKAFIALINFMLKYNCKCDYVTRNIQLGRFAGYVYSSVNYRVMQIANSDRTKTIEMLSDSVSDAITNAEERLYDETKRNSASEWAMESLYFKSGNTSSPLYDIKGLNFIPLATAYDIGSKNGGRVHTTIKLGILFE